MKVCPLCAEWAPLEASHCKHCGIQLLKRGGAAACPQPFRSPLNGLLSLVLLMLAGLATCSYFWWLH